MLNCVHWWSESGMWRFWKGFIILIISLSSVRYTQQFHTCIMYVLKYSSGIQCGSNKAAIGPVQTGFLKGDPVRSNFVWKGNADVVWTEEPLNSLAVLPMSTILLSPANKLLLFRDRGETMRCLMRQKLTKSSLKSFWNNAASADFHFPGSRPTTVWSVFHLELKIKRLKFKCFCWWTLCFSRTSHNLTLFQPHKCPPRDPLTAQYSVYSGRLWIVAVIKPDLGEKSRKILHGPQQEKGHLKR